MAYCNYITGAGWPGTPNMECIHWMVDLWYVGGCTLTHAMNVTSCSPSKWYADGCKVWSLVLSLSWDFKELLLDCPTEMGGLSWYNIIEYLIYYELTDQEETLNFRRQNVCRFISWAKISNITHFMLILNSHDNHTIAEWSNDDAFTSITVNIMHGLWLPVANSHTLLNFLYTCLD